MAITGHAFSADGACLREEEIMGKGNANAIYIEPRKDGGYKGTFGTSSRNVVSTPTQQRAIDAAHRKYPDAAVYVARVRDTKYGHRDQFRKVH